MAYQIDWLIEAVCSSCVRCAPLWSGMEVLILLNCAWLSRAITTQSDGVWVCMFVSRHIMKSQSLATHRWRMYAGGQSYQQTIEEVAEQAHTRTHTRTHTHWYTCHISQVQCSGINLWLYYQKQDKGEGKM